MSNQAITWALDQNTGGPGTKILLIALANYANADDDSYPSIERLARDTDQSTASVKRNIVKLVELGLIERIARGGDGEGRQTNRYHLQRGAIAQDEPLGLGIKKGGARDQIEGGYGSPVIPKPKNLKNLKDTSDPDFSTFYRTYPRHIARGAAAKAWKAAIQKAEPALIIAAAERFAAAEQRTDPKFIPHPATWLNAERWADDDQRPRDISWWDGTA